MTQYSLTADRRTSWLPPVPLISAKLLELRKRRTLMVVTVAFTVGLPVIFYGIRLLYHLGNPARYAPAGALNAFATVGILMAEFGFIAAAALGATAGTADLTDGMFRHLVITGRSRLALYLARIPAGLSILLSLAAVGFAVACLVTAFLGSPQAAAGTVNLSPGAMIGAGLWLELDLVIGFTVGLGLGSLMGQRTVPVVLLTVLEIIITPALASHALPYFLDGERLVVGVAMDQLKPAALAAGQQVGPGGGVGLQIPPMPTWAMITVIAGWIIGWSVIGAWRMVTCDA
jgi:hypothetical protein